MLLVAKLLNHLRQTKCQNFIEETLGYDCRQTCSPICQSNQLCSKAMIRKCGCRRKWHNKDICKAYSFLAFNMNQMIKRDKTISNCHIYFFCYFDWCIICFTTSQLQMWGAFSHQTNCVWRHNSSSFNSISSRDRRSHQYATYRLWRHTHFA